MSDRLLKESDVLKAIDRRVEELSVDPAFMRKNGHIDVAGVKKHILAIPSADRPQGEWIAKTENYHSHWVCSECGAWALLEYNEQMCLSNFCPNCGARMKGADDE